MGHARRVQGLSPHAPAIAFWERGRLAGSKPGDGHGDRGRQARGTRGRRGGDGCQPASRTERGTSEHLGRERGRRAGAGTTGGGGAGGRGGHKAIPALGSPNRVHEVRSGKRQRSDSQRLLEHVLKYVGVGGSNVNLIKIDLVMSNDTSADGGAKPRHYVDVTSADGMRYVLLDLVICDELTCPTGRSTLGCLNCAGRDIQEDRLGGTGCCQVRPPCFSVCESDEMSWPTLVPIVER